MNVAFMEWEETQSGEYINRTVSALHTADELKTPTDSQPAQGSNNKSWPQQDNKKFIHHGHCMVELMKMATINSEGGNEIDKDYLKDLLDIFKRGVDYMVSPSKLTTPKPEPKKEPEPKNGQPTQEELDAMMQSYDNDPDNIPF